MKNVLPTILLASIFIGVSKASIVEDFDNGYDQQLFTISNSDPDSSFGVSEGKLVFNGDSYTGRDTSERGGCFVMQNKIYGDFTATAELSGFNAPLEGGGKFVLASICIWGNNGEIARIGRRKGYAANYDEVVVKINTEDAVSGYNQSFGTMKIERIGTTINTYWDDTLVLSSFFGDTPVTIGLIAERWGTVSYFDAAFDDFTIVPEPCTLLLLGFGGLMLRKRKS